MNKLLLTIAVITFTLAAFAQIPTSFQYQAVLRDATGQVLASQDVEIGIAILQGSASGTEVFTETHLVTTNNFGLANLQIGSVNPAGMKTVDWGAGPYFVQVSVDGTVMGTSQLLSVPFAMHAVTVENDAVDDADSDPTNEIQDISLSGNELSITGGSTVVLPDEVDDADADPTNELQVLSIKGDTIFLSGGGYALLPAETDPQFSAWDKSSGVTISESQISDLKHFTNSDETDPVFDSSLANQITESDTTRWGNDADPTNELQYLAISNDTIYLTNGGFVKLPVESDPQFSAWDKSTGVAISESQITDLTHFTNSDETDPVFESSLAKQITANDTTRWGNDADPTNELQDISLDGTDLSIAGGSTVNLSVLQDGTGTDNQRLSFGLNNQGKMRLNISGGNYVDLPFLKEEEDGDPTNELNTSVVLNVADLEVTDAGGTITTDLSSLIDDADADPANELNKSVDLNGTDLEVTDAGGTITTDLSTLIDDADADPSNEIQVLSISNDTIYLSDGGKIKLPAETDPVYAADSAATKQSLKDWNGSVAKTISAIDTTNWNNKVDTLIAGTGISISGDTIKATGNSSVTTYIVGDFAQGGIVFWVDETGQHGLVCTKKDQSTGVRWYAGTTGVTRATGDWVFAGELNTAIIISSQVAIGDDGSDYAAQICNDLQVTEGGTTYGDWYLPSKKELDLMFQNKATIDATAGANGGSSFAREYYWCSTEYDSISAWMQDFGISYRQYDGKDYRGRVRAVRAF